MGRSRPGQNWMLWSYRQNCKHCGNLMTKKNVILIFGFLFLAAVVLVVSLPRHADIDEWSRSLTVGSIDIAEVSSGYGISKRSYGIPGEEYRALIALLRSVTEANSSRKTPNDLERIDCRLALITTDGKLWLFHCYENGLLGLMFHDPETGAYFGCEGNLLYIKSPELWSYIVNTVNEKAT